MSEFLIDTKEIESGSTNVSNEIFNEEYKTNMSSKTNRKREINILILGETGVGKSTWINSIVHYLTYSSLEEAANQEKLLSLIPASFAIPTDKYEMKEIKIGDDMNEERAIGQSATQNPKPYVFEQKSRLVRFIDTPGIGDTRGIERDKKNFDNILKYLASLDTLNGVCILLKPNNARLNIMFRFCINEFLIHLHKDASKNIVFCFTSARSTFYRPGDTYPALQVLLKENKNTVIPLGKDNVFCLDNEAFRFLCALRENVKFDENDKKNFSASWEKSVAETSRMIDFISGLQPHSLTHTLFLNETRKIVASLTQPVADIAKNIQVNTVETQEKETEIMICKASKADLEKKLYIISAYELVPKNLPHPRTVCTAPKCVKQCRIPNTNMVTTDYFTHCHENCYCTESGAFPNASLQKCQAMNQKKSCKVCGCCWSTHLHVRYEYERIPIRRKDETIEKAIQSIASKEETFASCLKELTRRTKMLEEEQRVMMDARMTFVCYLKTNAIAPYNDAMAEYLEMLIGQEKAKVNVGGDNEVLAGLNRMMVMYEKEKDLFEKTTINGVRANVLGSFEIKNIVENVYNLEVYGSRLKDIVETVEAETKQTIVFSEIVIRQELVSSKEQPSGGLAEAASSM